MKMGRQERKSLVLELEVEEFDIRLTTIIKESYSASQQAFSIEAWMSLKSSPR